MLSRRCFITAALVFAAALNTFGADTSAIAGVWTGGFQIADRKSGAVTVKAVTLVYVINSNGTGTVSVSGVKSTVTVGVADAGNGVSRYRFLGGSIDPGSRCVFDGTLENGRLVGTLNSVPAGGSRSLTLQKKG
jgi:hypothetical protein